MAVLPILKLGHPTLRRVADPVPPPPFSGTIETLARDMIETMQAASGVGLAAPQVGVSLRMLVYYLPAYRVETSRHTVPMGPRVLINPELEPVEDEIAEGPEGCLSIPGLRGEVPRYTHIRYRAYSLDGTLIEGEAYDYHARILQHEVDHLDGVVYLDRMPEMLSLGYVDVVPPEPVKLVSEAALEEEMES
jgi:peptide deformylase